LLVDLRFSLLLRIGFFPLLVLGGRSLFAPGATSTTVPGTSFAEKRIARPPRSESLSVNPIVSGEPSARKVQVDSRKSQLCGEREHNRRAYPI
jgi:hypothetical protein